MPPRPSYQGLGWTVVVRQDTDVLAAEAGRHWRGSLLLGALAVPLAALLGWVLAGVVARPLAGLADAANRIGPAAPASGRLRMPVVRPSYREAQAIAGAVERLVAELAGAAETRAVLVHEADHRVKNSLQTVAAVLALQRAQVADPAAQAALAEAEGRVRAVAKVHRALYQADVEAGRSVDLGLMLRDLCEQLGRTLPSTVALSCEPAVGLVHLPAERALPVGLLVAELLANAAKHAYPHGRAGTVWVELRRGAEGGTEVELVDDGIGAPEDALTGRPRGAGGLGMRLVERTWPGG